MHTSLLLSTALRGLCAHATWLETNISSKHTESKPVKDVRKARPAHHPNSNQPKRPHQKAVQDMAAGRHPVITDNPQIALTNT